MHNAGTDAVENYRHKSKKSKKTKKTKSNPRFKLVDSVRVVTRNGSSGLYAFSLFFYHYFFCGAQVWPLVTRNGSSGLYASDQATSITQAQSSDLLPDENFIIPPKLPLPTSLPPLFFRGASISGAGNRSLMSFALAAALLFLDESPDSLFFVCFFDFERVLKIERILAMNPDDDDDSDSRLLTDLTFFNSGCSVDRFDRWRLRNLRCRSLFDRTLPIHDTLGEPGSATEDEDLLGKRCMLVCRRLLASTKQEFCGFGKPIMEDLDLRFEYRCE
ncbi:hypothetical protein LINGRAHAP2_LOCUS4781 [Linum grandiflorum]